MKIVAAILCLVLAGCGTMIITVNPYLAASPLGVEGGVRVTGQAAATMPGGK